VNGNRTPITSNKIIEQSLGKFNIICVEGLIHEIFTVGPNFPYASNFLWLFKLNTPTGGLRKKTMHLSKVETLAVTRTRTTNFSRRL
jgi:large subunit ribosomal protein L7e